MTKSIPHTIQWLSVITSLQDFVQMRWLVQCWHGCAVVHTADIDMKQSMMKVPTDSSVDTSLSRLGQQLCGGSEAAIRHLLVFGRYLHQLSLRLVSQQTSHADLHRRMLRVSFQRLVIFYMCTCVITNVSTWVRFFASYVGMSLILYVSLWHVIWLDVTMRQTADKGHVVVHCVSQTNRTSIHIKSESVNWLQYSSVVQLI